jgi:uncharacterized membrane protein YGL010W
MSPALQKYFADYDGFHHTRGNKICHTLGIPLIVVATLGFFQAGIVLWALASAWYIKLDWRIGLPFSLLTLAGYFLGRATPHPILITIFILGWIFQGVGHAIYEKKSPAFLKNLTHLLIGPLWIYAGSSIPRPKA